MEKIKITLCLAFLFLFTLWLSAANQRIFLKDIRLEQFFILEKIELSRLKDISVFRDEKIVDAFDVIKENAGLLYCKLKASNALLDSFCYVEYSLTETKPEIAKTVINPMAENQKVDRMDKPQETPAALYALGAEFKWVKRFYLNQKPIPLTQVGGIEYLDVFIKRIQRDLKNEYTAALISPEEISEMKSVVLNSMNSGLYPICIIDGNYGYAYWENNQLKFKTVANPSTFDRLISKFVAFFVVKKK
jgi:hypothetical protein